MPQNLGSKKQDNNFPSQLTNVLHIMSFNGIVDGPLVPEIGIIELLLSQSASDLEMDRLCVFVAVTALFCRLTLVQFLDLGSLFVQS